MSRLGRVLAGTAVVLAVVVAAALAGAGCSADSGDGAPIGEVADEAGGSSSVEPGSVSLEASALQAEWVVDPADEGWSATVVDMGSDVVGLGADVVDLGPVIEPLLFAEANLDGSVVDEGDELRLDADIFFEFDRADLTTRARNELAAVAAKIDERGVDALTVVGHTDDTGSADYNLDLSRRRAQAIADALADLVDGSPTIAVDGRGETEPIAENDSDQGRALNRRVEIRLG